MRTMTVARATRHLSNLFNTLSSHQSSRNGLTVGKCSRRREKRQEKMTWSLSWAGEPGYPNKDDRASFQAHPRSPRPDAAHSFRQHMVWKQQRTEVGRN